MNYLLIEEKAFTEMVSRIRSVSEKLTILRNRFTVNGDE